LGDWFGWVNRSWVGWVNSGCSSTLVPLASFDAVSFSFELGASFEVNGIESHLGWGTEVCGWDELFGICPGADCWWASVLGQYLQAGLSILGPVFDGNWMAESLGEQWSFQIGSGDIRVVGIGSWDICWSLLSSSPLAWSDASSIGIRVDALSDEVDVISHIGWGAEVSIRDQSFSIAPDAVASALGGDLWQASSEVSFGCGGINLHWVAELFREQWGLTSWGRWSRWFGWINGSWVGWVDSDWSCGPFAFGQL
jgi:hypothetical protein